MYIFRVLLAALLAAATGTATLNTRPVIGILTQETVDDDLKPFGKAYIPASYVKFVESAGSRVAPIKLNLTYVEYKEIFNSINGLMLIGGSVNLQTSDFAKAANIFYKLALQANDKGDYFPIWGTCLGFQLLTVLVAGENLLTYTPMENKSVPLNFSQAAYISRMFRTFTPELMKALSQEPLTGNFHHYGISKQDFFQNKKLVKFFSDLTTNVAMNGVEFVSVMEGKKYPFYGVQWHPEVSAFQWNTELAFPHSPNAIWVAYLLADFFINEARKNFHRFSDPKAEEAALIYNHIPMYVGNFSFYTQIYFF
ncbi:gamma-glutamyl hydrolase [Erpetoichthys calabaricus]|uniref:folate gamma-glutamyl hydrolase n=1 Tax=Erpetoichthys calabaricus TaxID=27687 RepID=A0A8C4RC93_ERPCA|nr:gamma-glutamyl hydrolase [Erpetoichthys calabaricus]